MECKLAKSLMRQTGLIDKRYIVMALVVGFDVTSVVRAEGLCIPRETVIFNCEMEKYTASLCQSIGERTLTYRSGAGGRLAMELSDAGKKKPVFFLSSIPYAGGAENHIRFSRSSYTYYFYDKTIKTSEGPEFSAGIVIYKDQRRISDLSCRNDASIYAAGYESITKESYRSIAPPKMQFGPSGNEKSRMRRRPRIA
jgi:hypothetical protein